MEAMAVTPAFLHANGFKPSYLNLPDNVPTKGHPSKYATHHKSRSTPVSSSSGNSPPSAGTAWPAARTAVVNAANQGGLGGGGVDGAFNARGGELLRRDREANAARVNERQRYLFERQEALAGQSSAHARAQELRALFLRLGARGGRAQVGRERSRARRARPRSARFLCVSFFVFLWSSFWFGVKVFRHSMC